MPSDAEARPEDDTNTILRRFLKEWEEWALHYHVAFSPAPADLRIARRLLQKYGLDGLRPFIREFWLTQSSPLTTGEYTGYPMVLFAAKVKEQHA